MVPSYAIRMGAALLLCFQCFALMAEEGNVDVQLDYELTSFTESADALERNYQLSNSFALRAEYYTTWADGNQSLTVKPFLRWDEFDSERTHGDIREFMWHWVADDFELKAGVGKVFWGVTESRHLVDIVNQTDAVESLDGEEKLGQPMIQLLLERDWGNLDLFLLPYHRERTFQAEDARLGFRQEMADAEYESSEAETNIDVAARYYTYIDDFEYAVSLFHGTGRDPIVGAELLGPSEFIPFAYYPVISQLGLELQYLYEGWAWKLEAIVRDGEPQLVDGSAVAVVRSPQGLVEGEDHSYFASVAGFEFTQVGVFDSRWDLGWVAEHLYDSRQDESELNSFEHDVLLGTRWVANDAGDTTLLVGVVGDYEYADYSLSLEASTRLWDGLTLELEGRLFAPASDNDAVYGFKNEDYVRTTLSMFF